MKNLPGSQSGFTMTALVIATIILLVASISFSQTYTSIRERSVVSVGGGYELISDENSNTKVETLDIVPKDNATTATSSISQPGTNGLATTSASTSGSEANKNLMSVDLFYVAEDASNGEAVANGRTLVCNSQMMIIPKSTQIGKVKETIKASITTLTNKDKNPDSMEFGPFNFLTAENLSFSSASISGGVVSIKLSHAKSYLASTTPTTRLEKFNQSIGLVLTSEVRDCVIKEQVAATALQFGTAKSVKVYVDDKLLK